MPGRGLYEPRLLDRGRVEPQRDVAVAIKTARELALLPYTQRSVNERGPGRGGGGGRGGPRGGDRFTPPAAEGAAEAEADIDADADTGADLGSEEETE